MSNLEDFEKIETVMCKAPLGAESLQNFYLGYMAKCLAQISDTLNEIKDTIKEHNDGNND